MSATMKRKKSHSPEHFHKVIEFTNSASWQLPGDAFHAEPWLLESQLSRKTHLNSVKEQLGQYDLQIWSEHTKARDPSTQILKTIRAKCKPQLLTQAWCKFYEILAYFKDLIPESAIKCGQLETLHLCEAPGGFISALNHFLVSQYPHMQFHWRANTLNPYYEGNEMHSMIPDDRLIAHTLDHWLFGADHSGDITKYYNSLWIKEKVTRIMGSVHLITADGSVDCMSDPGNQELHVAHLHYCETMTALSILAKGGTFVLKIFTAFEHQTICLLYLLCCAFRRVTMLKPITSKGGNSETYVISKNYKGIDIFGNMWPQLQQHYKQPDCGKAMFGLNELNTHFLDQMNLCSEYFMRRQIFVIEENIANFGCTGYVYNEYLRSMNAGVVDAFFRQYMPSRIKNGRFLTKTLHPIFKIPDSINMPHSFLFYEHDGAISFRLITGKRLHKVLYSKFDDANRIIDLNKNHLYAQNSLYHLVLKSLDCKVIDCLNVCKNQYELHHYIFSEIDQFVRVLKGNEIVIVNLHLISNFLVGLLYILSQQYTIFFSKYNVIRLKRRSHFVHDLNEQLFEINEKLRETGDSADFESDVLEFVDITKYNTTFYLNVCMYNKYFC